MDREIAGHIEVNTGERNMDLWLAWAEKRERKKPYDLIPRMIRQLIGEVRRLRALLAEARGETDA